MPKLDRIGKQPKPKNEKPPQRRPRRIDYLQKKKLRFRPNRKAEKLPPSEVVSTEL
jgi:hypothetical protein